MTLLHDTGVKTLDQCVVWSDREPSMIKNVHRKPETDGINHQAEVDDGSGITNQQATAGISCCLRASKMTLNQSVREGHLNCSLRLRVTIPSSQNYHSRPRRLQLAFRYALVAQFSRPSSSKHALSVGSNGRLHHRPASAQRWSAPRSIGFFVYSIGIEMRGSNN